MAVVRTEELLLRTRAGTGGRRTEAAPQYSNEYVILVGYLLVYDILRVGSDTRVNGRVPTNNLEVKTIVVEPCSVDLVHDLPQCISLWRHIIWTGNENSQNIVLGGHVAVSIQQQ